MMVTICLMGGVGDNTLTGQGGVSTSFNLQDVTSPIDALNLQFTVE